MSSQEHTAPTKRDRRLNQRRDQSPSIIQQTVYDNPFTVEGRASGSSTSRQNNIELASAADTPPTTPAFQSRQPLRGKRPTRSHDQSLQRDGSSSFDSLSLSSEKYRNTTRNDETGFKEVLLEQDDEEDEKWTITPRISLKESSQPSKNIFSAEHWLSSQGDRTGSGIDGEDTDTEFNFLHDGASLDGYARPSTPLKRKQNEAFEQSQNEVGDESSYEDVSHEKHNILGGSWQSSQQRYGAEDFSQNSGTINLTETKHHSGHLLQRRRLQQQQQQSAGQASTSTLPNVFQSTPSSNTLSSTSSRTPEYFLPQSSMPAPSGLKQFEFAKDFPTTPTGRGIKSQAANPPPLWSRAGRKAVMQLKYGIYDEDIDSEQEMAETEVVESDDRKIESEDAALSEPGHSSDRSKSAIGEETHLVASAELAKRPVKATNSRLLTTDRFQKQKKYQKQVQQEFSISDEVHVYREEDLGDALNVSNTAPKVDETSKHVSDTGEHQIASDAGFSRSSSGMIIDKSEEIDKKDEDIEAVDKRIYEMVRKRRAEGRKVGESWSSSTSSGRTGRDGSIGGEVGLRYRKVGESSWANQQQQRQQQQWQRLQDHNEEVDKETVEDTIEEALETTGPEFEDLVGSEVEVESESKDAKIKRLMEAEMAIELLEYRAGMFSTNSLLEELGRDYCQSLTKPEELEHLTWMYEVARINRPQRMSQ
ncbi:hypothetical protein BGZ46_000265 [Entomortierella lignicola]|nr:hypothetical protein BGZ46_000265 [Entomortierella lignicola]